MLHVYVGMFQCLFRTLLHEQLCFVCDLCAIDALKYKVAK